MYLREARHLRCCVVTGTYLRACASYCQARLSVPRTSHTPPCVVKCPGATGRRDPRNGDRKVILCWPTNSHKTRPDSPCYGTVPQRLRRPRALCGIEFYSECCETFFRPFPNKLRSPRLVCTHEQMNLVVDGCGFILCSTACNTGIAVLLPHAVCASIVLLVFGAQSSSHLGLFLALPLGLLCVVLTELYAPLSELGTYRNTGDWVCSLCRPNNTRSASFKARLETVSNR